MNKTAKFVAKARNNDTVDVYLEEADDPEADVSRITSRLWLVFTCDKKVAEVEEACWIAILRTGPGNTRAALSFLVEAWPSIDVWAKELAGKPVPPLLCEFQYTQPN